MRINDLYVAGTITIQNGFPCGDWNEEGRGIPHLRPFNVTHGGQIDLSTVKYIETNPKLDAYWLRLNDIVFNNTNSEELVGKTALWMKAERAVISNHMTIVRVRDASAADASFLAMYLLHKWREGHFKMVCRRHVNQASVSRERLCDLAFPAFSTDVQRKIAIVLSAVQRAIERQERLITLTAELKKALMHKLFTEGTRGEPLNRTGIGPVPESWKVEPLGELFSREPSNGLYRPQSDYGRGTLILRIDDFSNEGDIVAAASHRVNVGKADSERFGLAKDDIVLNRVNSLSHLGKTALIGDLNEPMLFESNMMRFRVDETRLRPALAFRVLNSTICKSQLIGMAKRAVAQSSVNQGDVARLLIPLPLDLETQDEILTILNALEAKSAAHVGARASLNNLFGTLLHQLMTAEIHAQDLDLSALE